MERVTCLLSFEPGFMSVGSRMNEQSCFIKDLSFLTCSTFLFGAEQITTPHFMPVNDYLFSIVIMYNFMHPLPPHVLLVNFLFGNRFLPQMFSVLQLTGMPFSLIRAQHGLIPFLHRVLQSIEALIQHGKVAII